MSSADTHRRAHEVLSRALGSAQARFRQGDEPIVPDHVRSDCATIFRSRTKAYRECLIGILLTRLCQPNSSIRHPYTGQGPRAFNGRALHDKVVLPVLRSARLACTVGPYRTVFQRQAVLDAALRPGLRDRDGYDALLSLISHAERQSDEATVREWLVYVLWCCLHEPSPPDVSVDSYPRLGAPQCDRLIRALLARPSRNILPFCLTLATHEAIVKTLGLPWTLERKCASVVRSTSRTGAELSVWSGDRLLRVIEVTESTVDLARLVSAFRTKIAHLRADYVFMVHLDGISDEVHEQAARYFSPGYDVDFVDMVAWLHSMLISAGSNGRSVFLQRMVDLISAPDVPHALRIAWNEAVHNAVQ